MAERLLEVRNLTKDYRLGQINARTLHDALTSRFARLRGREDPNQRIGVDYRQIHNASLRAVDDVSFDVDRGETLAVVGRNGAGKSTLFKLISRITAPTAGEIRIKGRVASLLEIGTGFQPDLTGRDNIFLNAAILGMNRAETRSKLDKIIEFSEIGEFIDTPVKRYSSGMHVKLAFAVAANLSPDLMICDEVLAVGDVAFQQKCLGKLRDVAREGCAVLYVSHNLRTVRELCGRGLYLERGKLLYDGTTDRAIDLYTGSGSGVTDVNLDELPRAKKRGESMRLTRWRFEGVPSPEYELDSHVDFSVTAVSHVPESALRLRIMLYSGMAAPVAMSQSPTFAASAGQVFTHKMRLPLDGLSAGEYAVKLSLISARPDGGSNYYDTVLDAAHIVVRDDPAKNDSFTWTERLWGNFRMKGIEIL